ncbi:DUF4439 domain-containing protein [Pseudarthrobacter sp. N5]|uniref:DUF4439 domain-containing protein n=1 Tax=Pseudarthrobacter sp. N5 TaxID=3418416 RepID=UPI003CEAAE3E
MNKDNRENRRPGHLFRYAILAVIAFLVATLGVALIPREAPAPAEPPFSERARAAALTETMRLRAAGLQLADSVSGAERQHYSQTVTLLTTQARALLVPDEPPAAGPNKSTPTASAATGTVPPLPVSAAGLVAGLSASGSQRIADSQTSDGGVARLLVSIGTAQLLQAELLASVAGLPAPAEPTAPPAALPAQTPPSPSCPPSTPAPPGPSLATALSVAVKTEVETVYGYQVALTRLSGSAAASAARLLARHETAVGEAESHSRLHCVAIPPREAGYTLAPLFLESPAKGLGSLESGTLPVYGDLVALSSGDTRLWAISNLLNAARRSHLWGADIGPFPGLVLDTAELPELQQGSSPPTVQEQPHTAR